MRRYHTISALWNSFYNKDFYRDVREYWGVNTLLYWLFLILVYGVLLVISDYKALHTFITTEGYKLADQVPTGKISEGKMTIDKASPYTIYFTDLDSKQPQAFALFDMTNHIMPQNTLASIIFHSNGYYFYQSKHKSLNSTPKDSIRSNQPDTADATTHYSFYSYPQHQSIIFSPEQAKRWVNKITQYFPAVIILFLMSVKLVFKLIESIFYAFVLLIFGACCKLSLTYGEAYKLSLVALTPAFVLTTLPSIFFKIPHAFLAAFIIELIYLFFAALSNRPQARAHDGI